MKLSLLTLKKEHTLYKSTVEHNGKNNTLKIGVSDGSEVAIAVYSIGGKDKTTSGININGEFEIGNNNFKDLVVYVKLSKIGL